jgi:signal transduction histidine kinase
MCSDEPSTASGGPSVAGNRDAGKRSPSGAPAISLLDHVGISGVASGHRPEFDPVAAAAILDLQERERVRIGFDLHDGPAQTMSAALLQVRMLQDLPEVEREDAIIELRATISASLEEIYDLIESLGGRGTGGCADVACRVRSCVDTFASRSGIPVTIKIDGDAGEVSTSLQIAAARIVQEALSNVSRHSGAHRVDVALQLSPSVISCRIADDGHGFNLEDALTSQRGREPYGLHSMRERARLLDGECTVDSIPGSGTEVRFSIPVWRG